MYQNDIRNITYASVIPLNILVSFLSFYIIFISDSEVPPFDFIVRVTNSSDYAYLFIYLAVYLFFLAVYVLYNLYCTEEYPLSEAYKKAVKYYYILKTIFLLRFWDTIRNPDGLIPHF